MNIVVSCIHYPVASGRYVSDALRRLGHSVRTLGDSSGNRIPWGAGEWIELDPKYAWQSDGDLTKTWGDWQPDLFIHMDSSFAYHHPSYADVPHVVYGVDNHVRDYTQAGVARYFLAHKAVSIQQYDDNTEWLPCAYDPAIFTPSPIAWADREYDVCLIGVAYPQRVQLVEALAKAGLKVLAGVGWVYNQYAEAYQNSRISLCVSAAGDVGQRVFETAAMGCVVLSDDCPDFAELGIGISDGIQIYKNTDNAVELAQYILDTEYDGKVVASDGQEWALPHTWDARAARIVEWWQETYGRTNEVLQASNGTPIEIPDSIAIIHTDDGSGSEAISQATTVNEDIQQNTELASKIDDLDTEVHAPAEIEELPAPVKPKRKKRGH